MLRLFESEELVRLGFVLYDIFIFFTKKGMRGGGGGGQREGGSKHHRYISTVYIFV